MKCLPAGLACRCWCEHGRSYRFQWNIRCVSHDRSKAYALHPTHATSSTIRLVQFLLTLTMLSFVHVSYCCECWIYIRKNLNKKDQQFWEMSNYQVSATRRERCGMESAGCSGCVYGNHRLLDGGEGYTHRERPRVGYGGFLQNESRCWMLWTRLCVTRPWCISACSVVPHHLVLFHDLYLSVF